MEKYDVRKSEALKQGLEDGGDTEVAPRRWGIKLLCLPGMSKMWDAASTLTFAYRPASGFYSSDPQDNTLLMPPGRGH